MMFWTLVIIPVYRFLLLLLLLYYFTLRSRGSCPIMPLVYSSGRVE